MCHGQLFFSSFRSGNVCDGVATSMRREVHSDERLPCLVTEVVLIPETPCWPGIQCPCTGTGSCGLILLCELKFEHSYHQMIKPHEHLL